MAVIESCKKPYKKYSTENRASKGVVIRRLLECALHSHTLRLKTISKWHKSDLPVESWQGGP